MGYGCNVEDVFISNSPVGTGLNNTTPAQITLQTQTERLVLVFQTHAHPLEPVLVPVFALAMVLLVPRFLFV